jgi:hypothetical protein
MTTSTDPEDGSLVEREGVDAGSARSTAEGPLLTGGTTTGRAGDRPEATTDDGGTDDGTDGRAGTPGPVTQPAQVWAQSSGVADPAAPYATESGQDEGSIA